MNRRTLVLMAGLILVLIVPPVFAVPSLRPATVANPVTHTPVTQVNVPDQALNSSPAIVPLGLAVDKGRVVEGYAILHYKKGFSHKGSHKPGGGKNGGMQCFKLLAKGARWKTTEPYVLDATNADGLSEAFVAATIAASFGTWDSEVGFDVFGLRDTGSVVDGVDTVAPDDKNEVFFGDIQETGVIATATVWGIFAGPPSGRELVEYDVVFDDPDLVWGNADINPALMDLQNIATHEFGHAVGLADLYEAGCAEETMYGYSGAGETKKRDLHAGDVQGINSLY